MHNLFTGNPVRFLGTSRRYGKIHVPAGRCQEWVSVITWYLHLSRRQVCNFQARPLPAKFCPRKIKPWPSAWHCSFIWKPPKAPDWLRSEEKGLHGDWREMMSASKGKSLSVATAGTPIWKAKSSPAIPPLLQITLLYSLWAPLHAALQSHKLMGSPNKPSPQLEPFTFSTDKNRAVTTRLPES